MNTKYETIFPKKVYRCSCLLNTVDECFQSGECSLIKILDSIMCYDFYLPILLEQIFCTRVGENKEGSLIVCREHLIVILLSKKNILVHQQRMDAWRFLLFKNVFVEAV